jgi:hypoxanthine phosphoribosyltransferase
MNEPKYFVSWDEYRGLVAEVARQISVDNWRPDYIVGITRGGLTAATMLSHYFDIPMETLKVSLRGADPQCESNLWMASDAFGYLDDETRITLGDESIRQDDAFKKNILIVDNINDSGKTLNWIRQDWQSGCLPDNPAWANVWGDNVRTAVLVDNTASDSEINIQYCGMEINKVDQDQWIVFPEELWWQQT